MPDFSRIPYQRQLSGNPKGCSVPANLREATEAIAGVSPYLRGPYATMYAHRPWTLRQYAGFATADKSNQFYKQNLAMGQRGLSVAFDLPTHKGYDSDHPNVIGDVGQAGVAIDSVEDVKALFQGIPLDKVSVSMTMNGAVIPILAFFILAAEETGVSAHALTGTIQNDILKEFITRNTYIYPPRASMRIVRDVFTYLSAHMPRFNSISISGYHMHEAGAPAAMELAYTLANGITYLEEGLKAGLSFERFVPRFSFFWGIGMKYFDEIAKLRAARVLWSALIRPYVKGKIPPLRAHAQTSGWSLTAQEPLNNIARTCIEALAALGGHTQSLHTNAWDEALALPSPESARIARNTQLHLQHETHIKHIVDPWGGSYFVEEKTNEIQRQARAYLKEIAAHGGMLAAIEAGIPKQRIEAEAAKRQARIDAGEEVRIGVNHLINEKRAYSPANLQHIDTSAVIRNQTKRIQQIKANRNNERVQQALHRLSEGCQHPKANVLALALEAARHRATLGEISYAMEVVFGRYRPTKQVLTGLYAKHSTMKKETEQVRRLCVRFEKQCGRRPRLLMAKLGLDGHDRGYQVLASTYADLGFDVDLSPLFQMPKEVARQAVQHDVHVIGISSLAGAHLTLIPQLIRELHQLGRSDMTVVAGGIIPAKDHDQLHQAGVQFIFGPGTIIPKAAQQMMTYLLNKHT